MNEKYKKKVMQIYIKVPAQIFELMQINEMLGKELDSWFVGQVLEEVEERKNEKRRQKQ